MMKRTHKLLALLILSTFTLFHSIGLFAQAAQHLKKDGTPDKRYSATKIATPPVPSTPTKKDGTADKRYKVNRTAPSSTATHENTSIPANPPVTKTVTTVNQPTGAHLKADGTPDKRYKANQPSAIPNATPVSAPSPRTQNTPPPSTSGSATIVNGRHLKKDGTPDMRYKENRTPGLDKNGTADKRYKANKP